MKFDIKSRFSGSILFTADIDCHENDSYGWQLGLAVRCAIKARANLAGANLAGANLVGANLVGASGLDKRPPQTIILPEGDLIVYKKLKEGVAKLLIPSDAKRSNASGRKCRAEYAKVLELPDGCDVGHSNHDHKFTYKVGETVRPNNWCDDWAKECAEGIHFFITKQEAENY